MSYVLNSYLLNLLTYLLTVSCVLFQRCAVAHPAAVNMTVQITLVIE